MVLKSKSTARWDFKPWQVASSIAVVGTVPGVQDFCPDTGVYNPDYTLAHLELCPVVAILCEDSAQNTTNANARLGNIVWREIVNGAAAVITPSNPNYDISGCAEGSPTSGTILVKRNASPTEPVTLEFSAMLTDARLGQSHPIKATFCIKSMVSDAKPLLLVDCCRVNSYNPLRDADCQAVHAVLMLGERECPAANRRFVWEAQRTGNTWAEIGSSLLDYFATVSADTATLTVNRKLMGDRQVLRCRAKYDRGGNPSAVALTDASPSKTFVFERVIRNLSLQHSISERVPGDTRKLDAQAIITDGSGVIPNVEQHLQISWLTVRNTATLNNPSYAKVAEGREAQIPTDKMVDAYGMQVECEVTDRGPLCAWLDSDGAILTDGGAILLIK